MEFLFVSRTDKSTTVPQVPINGRAATILSISFIEMTLAVLGVFFRTYAARTGASRLRCDFWFVVGGTVRLNGLLCWLI